MKPSSAPLVRVSRRFSAPPDEVFQAWISPLRAARWLFTTRAGRMVQADVSDVHGLVTRVAQELGEHRRQRVVDEQPH